MMDTVKLVETRENDFLYEMINNYKWCAELFENGVTKPPIKELAFLNKKLEMFNDLYDLNDVRHTLNLGQREPKFFSLIDNRPLLNFDDINSIRELNAKIDLDINVMHKAFT
jgi:hypothetical protein